MRSQVFKAGTGFRAESMLHARLSLGSSLGGYQLHDILWIWIGTSLRTQNSNLVVPDLRHDLVQIRVT